MLEIAQRRLDELGQVVGQVAVTRPLKIVVIGILRESSVHESPREVIDRVLLRLDRLGDRLGAQVVREVVIEVRLDRQRLVQELAIERFLGRVAEQHAAAHVVH